MVATFHMKSEDHIPIATDGIHRPLRTLIVDNSAAYRTSLCQFLAAEALVQVVGTAANGSEALSKAKELLPDLVLIDLHMPVMDGLQATALLRCCAPSTRIIIMTLDETVKTRAAAHAHGAHGFLGKAQMFRTLKAEIQRVSLLNEADDEGGAA